MRPKAIKVPATTGLKSRKGFCPVRPSVDPYRNAPGVNPMAVCMKPAKHKGPHSWEV